MSHLALCSISPKRLWVARVVRLVSQTETVQMRNKQTHQRWLRPGSQPLAGVMGAKLYQALTKADHWWLKSHYYPL